MTKKEIIEILKERQKSDLESLIFFLEQNLPEDPDIETFKCPRCGSESIMHVQNH